MRFSLLFCAFLLSFPRGLKGSAERKSSFFSGDPRLFFEGQVSEAFLLESSVFFRTNAKRRFGRAACLTH